MTPAPTPAPAAVRHFLVDTDLTAGEQAEVLDLAAQMKTDRFAHRPLAGPRTGVVFFDKTSTRTRVSFAAGIAELGGSPLIVNPGESQLGHKESVADTARVLERMVGIIVWRTFAQSGLEEMAAHSRVPVVNALSDDYHPCQILADLLTVREHLGGTQGRVLAYLGDAANNMAHSYLLGCATAGMHVRIAGPAGYLPAESDSGMFGGNSNWRGPVWLPVNALLIDSRSEELAQAAPGIETRLTPLPEAEIRAARPGSAVVILTHDHALDFLLAAEALSRGKPAHARWGDRAKVLRATLAEGAQA